MGRREERPDAEGEPGDPDHCLKDGGVEGVRPREMQTHREDPIGMTRGREREKETIGISRIKIVEALHLALDRYPERLTPGAGVEEKATEAAVRVEIEIHQEILLDAVSHHCRDAEVESLPHAPVERRMMQRQVIAVAAHLGASTTAATGSLASLLKTGDEPKPTGFFGAAPGHMGAPRHTVEMDEKWLNHVLGPNGGDAIRKIETDTGCCVRFDKTRAAEGNTTSFVTHTIDVEHSVVGAVMGKNGELLREMAAASGAILTFERDKPGREGCDELKVVGQKDQVELAERLINQKMDEALTIRFGADQFGEPEATVDVNVEQQFIGWVMGKSKETIKHITATSGTTIHVKQFMKTKGFSVIRVMGARTSVEQAHQMIEKRVEQGRRYQADKKAQFDRQFAGRSGGRWQQGTSGDGGNSAQPESDANFLKRECDDAFQVDQRWVGYIIGPGGKTFKEIKETSGAKVYIDQDTKDQGFSIIRIGDSGTPENMLARELILKKMKECKALPANQRMAIYQQSIQQSQQLTAPNGQVVPPPPGIPDGGGAVSKAAMPGFPAQAALPSPVPQQPGLVSSVSKQQPHPNAMVKAAPVPVPPPKSAMTPQVSPFGMQANGKSPPEKAGQTVEKWSDDFAQKYFEAAFDQIYNNASLDARSKLEKLEGTIAVAKIHLAPHMEATLRRIIDNVKSTL
eukprot:CAMPEP_0169151770 /NCGR_PEP_ID=MMETSP1015-20121227/51056_1 /TAXON_ID=342587 /ORGANISM="Karlodinium micrum, Strain CCMP2283" /LENGTH=686 /DNA_ID=CAMNT_0009221317 /DNA_START=103 /DNA_END=2164 /DNA_ORIENTATION=+